ncbi:hypothetical protein JCM12294_39750 [Desulfocicer niacini]
MINSSPKYMALSINRHWKSTQFRREYQSQPESDISIFLRHTPKTYTPDPIGLTTVTGGRSCDKPTMYDAGEKK